MSYSACPGGNCGVVYGTAPVPANATMAPEKAPAPPQAEEAPAPPAEDATPPANGDNADGGDEPAA